MRSVRIAPLFSGTKGGESRSFLFRPKVREDLNESGKSAGRDQKNDEDDQRNDVDAPVGAGEVAAVDVPAGNTEND